MILYRPVNKKELDLIAKSDWSRFPPRLPEQPIFYPVLSLNYAKKINEWNIADYGEGYVVEFEVDDRYLKNLKVHNVGAEEDNEFWIPADRINHFNSNIIGKIRVI